MMASGQVKLLGNASYYAGFEAPLTMSVDQIWKLPAQDGGAGDVLKTDGANNTYWGAAVPLGSVIGVATYMPGAFDSASGVVTDGFIFCNGDPIPAGNAVQGTTPNMTDNRFLMGSTTSGLRTGANTHRHSVTSNVSVDDHADHTHGMNHAHMTMVRGDVVGKSSNEAWAPTGTSVSSNPSSSYDMQAILRREYGNYASGSSGANWSLSSATSYTSLPNYSSTGGVSTSSARTHGVTNNAVNSGYMDHKPRYLTVKYFMRVN
jgi:hypothetical protein